MQTVDTHGTFDDVVSASSPDAQDLARRLRALIIDVYPDVYEVPWTSQRIAGYGVGPKKMTEHFSYIAAQKDYASLGFNYGATLPDPDGLLEGTGNLFRHVKIRRVEDVERPALRALLEAAMAERQAALQR